MNTLWALFSLWLTLGWAKQVELPTPASCRKKDVQLTVELYYESLCPDTLNFVVDQMKPAVKELGNCVTYHLIPWGNAKIVSGSVECQHGKSECLGNKLHACSFPKLNGNLRRVEFITCYFESILALAGDIRNVSSSSRGHVLTAAKKCANEFKLNWKDLAACAEGAVGDGHHLAYSEITAELNPKLNWVPMTLVYEPQRTNEDESTNFLGRLCKSLKEKGIPCGNA